MRGGILGHLVEAFTPQTTQPTCLGCGAHADDCQCRTLILEPQKVNRRFFLMAATSAVVAAVMPDVGLRLRPDAFKVAGPTIHNTWLPSGWFAEESLRILSNNMTLLRQFDARFTEAGPVINVRFP